MKEISLMNFRQVLLANDIKYLIFNEKNINKLYMIEDYTTDSLEDHVRLLNKLNNIDEVKNYFIKKDPQVNIFEFIALKDIKKYYDTINKMNELQRKKLALIIKESKNLDIRYINLTFFFVINSSFDIYYINEKNGVIDLKKLKVERVIEAADYKKIVKEIKTYNAFKYQNRTIKYEEIKPYIDNPLLSPNKDNALIEGIRDEMLKDKIYNKEKGPSKLLQAEELQKKEKAEKEAKKVRELKKEPKKINSEEKEERQEKTKEIKEIKKINMESLTKDNSVKMDDNHIKPVVVKKKKSKSLLLYCFIGFSAGVVLAAITILIGNFM